MPHQDQRINLPSTGYSEDAELLRQLRDRIAVLPGRVAVLMDLVSDKFSSSALLVPQGTHAGKYRPDAGTVISSGVTELKFEDRVLVKPYDGLWMTNEDVEWAPKGREVRFYGVAAPWFESVVAIVGR